MICSASKGDSPIAQVSRPKGAGTKKKEREYVKGGRKNGNF